MTGHPKLSPAFRAELEARRGGQQVVFSRLEPRRTALLVIDMQNVFVAPESPLAVASAPGILAAINTASRELRSLGGRVFWVRSTFTADGRTSWPLYFEHFAPAERRAELRSLFSPGNVAHDFYDGLEREPEDEIVDKDRFSPFSPGASDIEPRLEAAGIDTLVIAGTLTNVCCESAMRDAMMRDYRCLLLDDATAAPSDADQLASLANAARYFGDVLSVPELVTRLRD